MIKIFVLPLSKLTKIDEKINESFINQLLFELPHIGKSHEKYWVINNNLTIYSRVNNTTVSNFNVFLQLTSKHNYSLLQLLKQ